MFLSPMGQNKKHCHLKRDPYERFDEYESINVQPPNIEKVL